MIYANPGQSFEVTSIGASGLIGSIGYRILDNQGGTVVSRTSNGIVEYPVGSGFYQAVVQVSPTEPGQYTVFWDTGSLTPGTIATEDLVVRPGEVISGDSIPTAEEVASLLFTRTKDPGGNYLGVFSDQTNPTRDRVLSLIGSASGRVLSDIGVANLDPSLTSNVRHMTTLYTAMLIELSHYSEQVMRDISPYKELRKLYESALSQLEDETPVDAGKGALDSAGNPNYHFDGFATGYKAW